MSKNGYGREMPNGEDIATQIVLNKVEWKKFKAYTDLFHPAFRNASDRIRKITKDLNDEDDKKYGRIKTND